MKLYSKENACRPFEAMSQTGRFVHSYIITGEKGTGKKTFARYIAMQLLCDNHNACGECRQCSRILRGQHPDFIEVDREGRVNYSVDVIREKVVADSCISPNDCDRKVYLLSDCEGWSDACQNAMLKVTEDPPEAAYFIFTAVNRNSFLSTLISRSMTIELHEADISSCREALSDMGKYSEEEIDRAVSLFGGNIGRCRDFLEGSGELTAAAEAVTKAMDAIVARDEYALAHILGSVSSKREEMRYALEMLARSVRDGAVIRNGGKGGTGCTAAASNRLAERFSTARILAMYDAVCEASYRCTRNCNAGGAAAVLAGKLCR